MSLNDIDFSMVKAVVIPEGSVKKIRRNGVVIWEKPSDVVYTWAKYSAASSGYAVTSWGEEEVFYDSMEEVQWGDTYWIDSANGDAYVTDREYYSEFLFDYIMEFDPVKTRYLLFIKAEWDNELFQYVVLKRYALYDVSRKGTDVNGNDYVVGRKANITKSFIMGDYIGAVTSADENAYPENGVHTDGYWYVKQ